MPNRKILFIAAAPLLLLLGMMLSFRILSNLPSADPDAAPVSSEAYKPAPVMRPADAATQEALESAVQGQLSAIRGGDYAKAITFSAPSFRNSWNPKRFQEMVENGYREMTESRSATFETGLVAENAANLRVVVTTDDQRRIGYIYNLLREGDGWYVQACSQGFPMGSGRGIQELGVGPKKEEDAPLAPVQL